MKRFAIGWIIGTVSLLLIGFTAGIVLSLMAMIGGWDSFTSGLGPIEFLKHSRDASGYSTETGWAFVPLAVVVGLLNGLGAVYLGTRNRPTT